MFDFCFDHANLCRHIFQPCFWNQDLLKSSNYQPSSSKVKCASDITLPEGLYKWMLTTIRPTKTSHWINQLTVNISMLTWIVALQTSTALKTNNPKNMEVWTMILISIWVIFGWFSVACFGPWVQEVQSPSTTWTTAPIVGYPNSSKDQKIGFPSLTSRSQNDSRVHQQHWPQIAYDILWFVLANLRGIFNDFYLFILLWLGISWATMGYSPPERFFLYKIPYTKTNPASIGTTLRDCHVKLGWWGNILINIQNS